MCFALFCFTRFLLIRWLLSDFSTTVGHFTLRSCPEAFQLSLCPVGCLFLYTNRHTGASIERSIEVSKSSKSKLDSIVLSVRPPQHQLNQHQQSQQLQQSQQQLNLSINCPGHSVCAVISQGTIILHPCSCLLHPLRCGQIMKIIMKVVMWSVCVWFVCGLCPLLLLSVCLIALHWSEQSQKKNQLLEQKSIYTSAQVFAFCEKVEKFTVFHHLHPPSSTATTTFDIYHQAAQPVV